MLWVCPPWFLQNVGTISLSYQGFWGERIDKYITFVTNSKIVSEYDQEIPQSLTADKPMNREEEPQNKSQDTSKTNQLSLPHQDDCKTRMDIK